MVIDPLNLGFFMSGRVFAAAFVMAGITAYIMSFFTFIF